MNARLPLDEQLRTALPDLTRAERQLATHVLSHYPVAALGSIGAARPRAHDFQHAVHASTAFAR